MHIVFVILILNSLLDNIKNLLHLKLMEQTNILKNEMFIL